MKAPAAPTLLGLRVKRLPEVMGRARLRRMPGLGNVIQWYNTGHCAVRKQYHNGLKRLNTRTMSIKHLAKATLGVGETQLGYSQEFS